MSFRIEDQPEYAGPQSEDFTPPAPAQVRPGPARPRQDPAAAAILRNLEAEQAADAGRTVPPDATEITS
jgi:hypothetical protein